MISFDLCWNVPHQENECEPEASELNLGKKIKTPKEIMLEELSLMKNRGSKMFKMRQQRVEKFIYENNPDIFTSESMVSARVAQTSKHFFCWLTNPQEEMWTNVDEWETVAWTYSYDCLSGQPPEVLSLSGWSDDKPRWAFS